MLGFLEAAWRFFAEREILLRVVWSPFYVAPFAAADMGLVRGTGTPNTMRIARPFSTQRHTASQ